MRKRRVCDYTEEQIEWISNNLSGWKNQKEFTEAFNKKFNTEKSVAAIRSYAFKHKITLETEKNVTVFYTEEQENWLRNNFDSFKDYVSMAKAYNERYSTDKTNWTMRRKCTSLGLVRPKKNAGMFVKNQVGTNGLPVGTIRYHSNGIPYIKIMECNGNYNKRISKGHNYSEPFWKPLQKKIWEDVNGEVPKGYEICSLNGNRSDTDINNIGIIKKSLKPRMAKNGWWSEEKGITATGIKWCELNELLIKGKIKEKKI